MCFEKNKNINEGSNETLICPIRHMISMLGGKWKLPIICMLSNGRPARYSLIKRKLNGITNVMLAQSLKELEEFRIVHREQYNEVPPRVEYKLTERVNKILPALIELTQWAAEDMKEKKSCGELCDRCNAMI